MLMVELICIIRLLLICSLMLHNDATCSFLKRPFLLFLGVSRQEVEAVFGGGVYRGEEGGGRQHALTIANREKMDWKLCARCQPRYWRSDA